MTLVNTETGELVEFDCAAAERRAERITLRLDAIADNYRAVLPLIREAIEKRDDIALGYRSPGDYVSDRFGQSLAGLGMDVRRAVVGELTEAGLSTRAIAPVVGVSDRQVRYDVQQVGSASHLNQTPAVAAGAAPSVELASKVAPVEEDVTAAAVETPTEDATATTPEAGTPAATRPPVVGIDGKTYSRPSLPTVAEAVAEFPDLAYYADLGEHRDVINMAGDLRLFRERGELDMRLDNLRRSICLDRAKRDGTYRAGTTAVMGDDGEYHMQPIAPVASAATTRTCPTCSGRGVIEEQAHD